MKRKDNDYSVFLVSIAIWMTFGGLAQYESARSLDGIRQELSSIRHELNMMRYK